MFPSIPALALVLLALALVLPALALVLLALVLVLLVCSVSPYPCCIINHQSQHVLQNPF